MLESYQTFSGEMRAYRQSRSRMMPLEAQQRNRWGGRGVNLSDAMAEIPCRWRSRAFLWGKLFYLTRRKGARAVSEQNVNSRNHGRA